MADTYKDDKDGKVFQMGEHSYVTLPDKKHVTLYTGPKKVAEYLILGPTDDTGSKDDIKIRSHIDLIKLETTLRITREGRGYKLASSTTNAMGMISDVKEETYPTMQTLKEALEDQHSSTFRNMRAAAKVLEKSKGDNWAQFSKTQQEVVNAFISNFKPLEINR